MPRLKIRVIPNAKKGQVLQAANLLKVYVRAPPVKGKANKEAIEALAEFFKVKKSSIRLVAGEKSREKTVEVD